MKFFEVLMYVFSDDAVSVHLETVKYFTNMTAAYEYAAERSRRIDTYSDVVKEIDKYGSFNGFPYVIKMHEFEA